MAQKGGKPAAKPGVKDGGKEEIDYVSQDKDWRGI